MNKTKGLEMGCLAIGSLPHSNVDEAMSQVRENFAEIPFWPQLAKINKNEDMIFQFLENMPGIVFDKEENKVYMESESDEFFESVETLFLDWQECTENIDSPNLDNYAISDEFSSTIRPFLNIVKTSTPDYAKGQIVGPFTLATTLCDKSGKCAYYDETLREVIVKTLTLKALWQIREIKRACQNTTPIIFIDEPSISQLGTSAFITIPQKDVLEMIKEVSDIIKNNGALSAIHCCGKCDWSLPVKIGVDILNFDAFQFGEGPSVYHKQIKDFLMNNGKIAWGIVPTLDKDALSAVTVETLKQKLDSAIQTLAQKDIDESLIRAHSIITPSCGAGSLSVELAQKAMSLTSKLSNILRGIKI